MHIQSPRRLTYLVAVFSLTLFACHQPDHPANTLVSRRTSLIAALKELRGRILSGDKSQIGRIFSFPVPDSVFRAYFDDSKLQQQVEDNGNRLTQQMFNAHFDKLSAAAELGRFKGVFSFISLDDLQHTDSIDVDTVLEKEGASRIYWIHILSDSLVDIAYGSGHCVPDGPVTDTTGATKDTLTVAKDSAAPLKDSTGMGDDTGEDPSLCEHMVHWEFSFDGKKLWLVHFSIAG